MAGARAIAHAASQQKVTLLGGGRHSIRPLDVDDLSRAILRCCETPWRGRGGLRTGRTGTHGLSGRGCQDGGADGP